MKTFKHRIDGDETTINIVERPDDFEPFRAWVEQGRPLVGADTETTGLDTFSPGFKLRTVQLGDGMTAWVLPVETGREIHNLAAWALRRIERLALHNSVFDLLVIDRHLGVSLEELAPKTTDTRILAHLLDPRGREDGGVGLSLKQLSAVWVDSSAPDTQEGLTRVFNSMGLTKETGWAAVPIDNPTYLLYAGLDVILTTRLAEKLRPHIHEGGFETLAEFEHNVARVNALLERKGMLTDREYLPKLSADLTAERDKHMAIATSYGVTSVNAPKQVATRLAEMGETLTERTDSGAVKVDKEVLQTLADVNRKWERIGTRDPNPLADAVLHAKRAAKWNTAYAEAIADLADADHRLHPKINSLQARTARMSISRPPLQQLPAGNSSIRRALIAEPGKIVCSIDYSAVEMRVLAALADDKVMKQAILDGEDLHDFTARLVYGPDFTENDRKVCKGVGFGKVYGGGAHTISRQTGAPMADVQHAITTYDKTYKGIKRYSRKLQDRGRYGSRAVYTPVGRRLPLDRDRLYAATNYIVQSTARDILAQALLNIEDAGLLDDMRLPVHDEMIFVSDPDSFREHCEAVQAAMSIDDFFGLPIDTEAEVMGRAWDPKAVDWVRTGNGEWHRPKGWKPQATAA